MPPMASLRICLPIQNSGPHKAGLRPLFGLPRELQAEGRTPNREEQHILAKFVGWGQFPALFNDINAAGEQLTEEREELKRLLGERDYDRAKASTINAHYTAPKIVEKMWDVAR